MKPTANSSTNVSKTNASYYTEGSTEVATETALTVKKLEPRRRLTNNSRRLVVVLVGLPARGKSFVARKLQYYFSWSGTECKIFNVGRYRREAYAEFLEERGTSNKSVELGAAGACGADFFDSHNKVASHLREKVAEVALRDMLKWLDNEDEVVDNTESSDSDLLGFFDRPDLSRQQGSSSHTLSSAVRERIAIFDATNSTNKRRQWILEECTDPEKRPGRPTGVIFVESMCDDPELLEENLRFKATNSPDYKGTDIEKALADLRVRVQKYEEQYETITDDSLSYIKMFNLSSKLLVNHIYGRIAKYVLPAFMAWHIGTRPIFLCRPGNTNPGIQTDSEEFVAKNRIDPTDPKFLDTSLGAKKKTLRGDSLGPRGIKFREHLLDFCYHEVHNFMCRRSSIRDMSYTGEMSYTGTSISGLAPAEAEVHSYSNTVQDHDDNRDPFPLKILTSTMPRAVDTVNWNDYEFSINDTPNLNPQDKGDFAGLELNEIQRENPSWYDRLERDPFGTRFPGGECYRDLIQRLTSVVIEIEQQVIPALVVSHLSTLQCLIAYFRNTPVEKCMAIDVPMHTVIKFTPVRGGGWCESRHHLFDEEEQNQRTKRSESESSLRAAEDRTEAFIWSDPPTFQSSSR